MDRLSSFFELRGLEYENLIIKSSLVYTNLDRQHNGNSVQINKTAILSLLADDLTKH